MAVRTLTQPYRVTFPMVLLVSMVPFYIFIADATRGRRQYLPEVALDRLVPLRPGWALVYGSLYLFLILLPVFVVRQQEQIRRTVLAYLTVWVAAYICFLVYPTRAPRPEDVPGDGFMVWGLRFLYDADPPYNCFPSLHVAHSFVSALTCYRVHRRVGNGAVVCAALVGLSTLFTKQHYVLDVIAGVFLACVAYVVFLRSYRSEEIPDRDRLVAPFLALIVVAIVGLVFMCYVVAYAFGVELSGTRLSPRRPPSLTFLTARTTIFRGVRGGGEAHARAGRSYDRAFFIVTRHATDSRSCSASLSSCRSRASTTGWRR